MTRLLSGLQVALVLTAIAFHGAAQGAESPRYTVAPVPDWVQSAPAEAPLPADSTQKASGGTEYQLSDVQVRVDDTWSQYYHSVSRPTNPAGVSDSSSISIDFDPELERLVLHAVTLRRGGTTIDELQQGRIEVLQRESKLESSILDGSLTFHLLMSDVRVGDLIEYSYTLERRDPAWGNRYFARYVLQWGDPIQRLRIRILSRSHAPLFVYSPPGKEPRKADDGTWQSLEWDEENVPAVKYEKDAPDWYEQYPAVQLSQFASWKDVVDVALPLFALPGSPDPAVAAQAKQLTSTAHSDAERVLNVIRFVQEEIRYTGLELGSGAYRPAQPQEVLGRRYGDCKDKTLLAVALLRDLGIDASPVLVSTRWGGHLHTRLPSPGNFNHAIVKARVQSKTYWLDVTSTAQGGDLQHTVQADLGDGLVIAPGVSALEEMPKEPADSPLVAAEVEFDLRNGTEKEGGLRVSTAYRGSEADSMRRTLRRKSPADLGDTYLNYYKGRYDSIRAVEPPKVTDDLRANQITIDESYRVDHFFEDDDSGKRRFSLEAETINDRLRALDTPVRRTPFDLETPVNLSQHIRIRMPEKFPGTDDVVKIETAQFQYISRVSHSGDDVLLDYHYRVLADEVPPEGLAEFVKKRASARDESYYRFTEAQEGPSRDAVNGAEKQLQEAGRLVQGTQLDKADEVLKSLLASDGFRGLASPRRHIAVYLAGVVALEKDDAPRALELLRRAARFDEADFGDWNMRLLAAARARDHAEATLTLTTLAEHWPENLGDVDARVIGRVVHDTPHTGASRYQLLGALSKANYKSEEGYDLSHWWRDLALLQLEHADQAAAKKTLEKLTDSAALISVRADNRFAPIRDGLSLDIPAAIASQVQQAREAVKAHPTKLHPVVVLMGVLRQSLDFAGAVQLADDAVSAMSGPKGPKIYDDYKESRVWLLDARAEALYRLGKWDEAVAQLTAARQLPEMGDVNVSQTINLASLYNDLGKPREARTTLAELASNVSPYGFMQAAIEYLASADQLGDAAEVEKQLALLKEHQQDSLSTYQRALISANRPDEAAQLLISRLQDPDQRIDALLDVQDYKEAVLGPRAVEWQKRWVAVKHRPDVVEAIGKVGTVSTYPVLPQPH